MSATMFGIATMQTTTKPPPQPQPAKTRIPVASPSPLRRSLSMRLKGDRSAATPSSTPLYPQEANRRVSAGPNPAPPTAPTLRRGKSFMERVEHRGNGHSRGFAGSSSGGGGAGKAGDARRSVKGSPSTEDNRARSLSLSFANHHRLEVPTSNSVSSSPRTPPTSPSEQRTSRGNTADWDTESVLSGISGISLASSTCDHASVARNGTTFSGRSMKYVFHCNQHAGATGEDYLTPTQRAHRQVRRLKQLLQQAQKDLEQRDSDIVKLTKEVVELRLYKAALSSPEERSNSSDAVTVRENQLDEVGELPEVGFGGAAGNHVLANEMNSSYTDSGHYDDYTNSSIHSKDSVLLSEDFNQSPFKRNRHIDLVDKAVTADLPVGDEASEHLQLMADYERRLQDLVKSHENESQEQRQKHNDKVEELLQRIADINKRYWELVPDLENAKDRLKELEGQLEDALRKLEEQEDKHKQAYLDMYVQGQAAAKLERETQVMELAQQVPPRISVPELLQQLQVTQSELENIRAMYKQILEAKNKRVDPEITLQFLKSAIYYFLTDKENNQGHLRAIQSILGFTPSEISNIEKARTA